MMVKVKECEKKFGDIRIFSYSRAKKGEEHCGDACLVEECDGNNIIIAVVDGLGHGKRRKKRVKLR